MMWADTVEASGDSEQRSGVRGRAPSNELAVHLRRCPREKSQAELW